VDRQSRPSLHAEIPSVKRPPILAALVLIAAACTPSSPPAAPSPPASAVASADSFPAAVRAAHDAYVAGWNAGDRAALAALFTEDARVSFGNETMEGRARIDERWLGEDVGKVSDLVMTPERVTRSGGEVTESGTATLHFRRGDDSIGSERGRYEHVWARQPDGAWKLRSVLMDTHPVAP
jgi:ketosteroid isomerase-like protein